MAIPGTKRRAYLEEAVAATASTLTFEDLQRLEEGHREALRQESAVRINV
ncbi:hypothetical protein H6F43_13055 [Leptolyngbya sp. FACHB-36]|nr:hypothetical protein [Leptolyngbya sp. FACHB-36]MBD2021109.1 hypothetical protein [Leptolyngbya sp. FACHB-36]